MSPFIAFRSAGFASLLAVSLVAWAPGGAAPASAAETPKPAAGLARATFAGGCFWCMQPPYEKIEGVVSVKAGYTGGSKVDPTYEEVSSGTTGHAESVEIVYDPKKVSYAKLVEFFWHNIDPTQAEGQFCDHGHQYRTAIFVHDEEQRKTAEASKAALEASKILPGPVVTEITAAGPFFAAEEYHQDFESKNPLQCHLYKEACGRERRLKVIWGAASGH